MEHSTSHSVVIPYTSLMSPRQTCYSYDPAVFISFAKLLIIYKLAIKKLPTLYSDTKVYHVDI